TFIQFAVIDNDLELLEAMSKHMPSSIAPEVFANAAKLLRRAGVPLSKLSARSIHATQDIIHLLREEAYEDFFANDVRVLVLSNPEYIDTIKSIIATEEEVTLPKVVVRLDEVKQHSPA